MQTVAAAIDPSKGQVCGGALLSDQRGILVQQSDDGQVLITRQPAGGTLWSGRSATPDSGVQVLQGAGQAICHVPGAGLFWISQDKNRVKCLKLTVNGDVPQRVFGTPGHLFGLVANGDDGSVKLARLTQTGSSLAAGTAFELPSQSTTPTAVVEDETGRLLVIYDSVVTGVQIWRQDVSLSWEVVTENGFSRYAFNAVLNDIIRWSGVTLCAVSGGAAVKRRLLSFHKPGEIVVVRDSTGFDVLCGETRISAEGLKVPLAGIGNDAALISGDFSHLISDLDTAYGVCNNHDGSATVFRISPDWSVTHHADIAGTVFDLVVGVDGQLIVLAES